MNFAVGEHRAWRQDNEMRPVLGVLVIHCHASVQASAGKGQNEVHF